MIRQCLSDRSSKYVKMFINQNLNIYTDNLANSIIEARLSLVKQLTNLILNILTTPTTSVHTAHYNERLA